MTDITLVDELASALNAATAELSRLREILLPHYESKMAEPDLAIIEQGVAAIGRYDLDRDRTDLDAASLPMRTIITLQDGAITGVITDFPHACELLVIDYDVDSDWEGADMVAIPQGDPKKTELAQAFTLIPTLNPPRVAVLFNAVLTHDCPSSSKH